MARALFRVVDCRLLLVPSHDEEQRKEASSLVTFTRAIYHEASTFMTSSNPNDLPKAHFLISSCGGGRV